VRRTITLKQKIDISALLWYIYAHACIVVSPVTIRFQADFMPPSAQRRDVAAEAGVSESTVSRALNDSPLISAPVKARIREIALRLGYVPNRQAALFARRRTQRLGFAVRSYHSFPPFSRASSSAFCRVWVLSCFTRVMVRRYSAV